MTIDAAWWAAAVDLPIDLVPDTTRPFWSRTVPYLPDPEED